MKTLPIRLLLVVATAVVEAAEADGALEAAVVAGSEGPGMIAVEAEMDEAAAGLGQGTPGQGTGSAIFLTAGTQTLAGGTNATSARHPSQKGLEAEMAEVRFQTLKVINCL